MNLNEAMNYLTQQQQAMLDFTVALVEINSGSFNTAGLEAVAELLRREMATLNCEQITMPVAPYQITNQYGEAVEYPLGDVLRFWKRPEAPMQVLIM